MGRAALAKASGRATHGPPPPGAASIDRASVPTEEHAGVGRPGTSVALLDHGTPAARHALAAEQQLALLQKQYREERDSRKLKKQKLSQENPDFATRAEQIRFLVFRALDNGRYTQTTKGTTGSHRSRSRGRQASTTSSRTPCGTHRSTARR